MAYFTRDELKAALGIGLSDTSEDDQLDAALAAAEEQVNNYCERFFYQDGTVQVRYFRPQDYCTVWVDDISTTAGLIVAVGDDNGNYPTTLTEGSDFKLAPYNAAARTPVWPYTKLESVGYTFPSWHRLPAVKVTAKFGWPAVPDAVTTATKLLAIDQYKLNSTAFGVVGNSDFGTIRAGDGINRQAATLLAPYRKAHE